ncbi:hypothetical protein Tsp_14500, partial [Trichinella spiralis]|uniref:hypothetical protein n=1 Tax=Trichinella spiralis TaxID=6334 RepID=UPI0001EFEDCA
KLKLWDNFTPLEVSLAPDFTELGPHGEPHIPFVFSCFGFVPSAICFVPVRDPFSCRPRSAQLVALVKERRKLTNRTLHDATTCHVSQTNERALTEDKAPLWRSVIS